ncbi:hypothetical protein BK809_0006079 [Diplodia seriata]|uniref:Uncharacterized protein n=1 Tax=Diplodia seriata TaxID=420778 RepID=A0A1S8B3M5_9PEZI|nr:hypothetical protein BK809_0006079 [Diplodia seriata]
MIQPPRASSSLSDAGSSSSTSSARSRASLSSIRMTNLYKATMNRFLTRKKTEAALESAADGPPPTTKKSKRGKKNKEEEPAKPQLDLSQALPSTDNFRTSLLMPNLSARFSMLREQDDPESKLGKASDDSVLFSKRQSRLTDFGFNPAGLTDIAEVASINDSIRPPFLAGRSGSIDYGTDDGDSIHSGSVMSRSRPGEGNVLFGGRQKVYLGNRALYDDDVGMSAYQRMRAEERRKKREEEGYEDGEEEEEDEEPGSPAHELKHASSFSGSLRRRETASSTASGAGARASTAATSIASQGANAVPPPSASSLERTGTKGRRLYDQGLDRNYTEGNSAISRLNSLQKQRSITTGRATPPLTQTRSATNLSDRFNRGNQYRPASPPPSAPLANMASFKAAIDGDSQQSSPALATSSPTSPFPPISPLDDNSPLASAIQPGDRGKATAMGAFQKPARQFDETQYMQRQKQMLQGRETPPPRKPSRSPSRGVQERLNKFEMKNKESEVKSKQPPAMSKNASDARKRLDALRTEIAADLDDLRPSSDSEEEPEKKIEERPSRSRSRTNSSSVVPPAPRVLASPLKPTTLPSPVSPPTQALPPTPGSPPRQMPAMKLASPPKRIPEEMVLPEPASPELPAKKSAFSVFQRAKQQMQAQANDEPAEESPKGQQITFFSSRNSSDDEDDDSVPEVQPLRSPVNRTFSRPGSKPQSPLASRSNHGSSAGMSPTLRSPPPVHEHPALRSSPGLASPASRASENMLQALNSPHESESKSSVSTMVKSDATDLDSPTLGPESGGLNSMIRQHLRNHSEQSGVSSVYDNDREDDDDNNHSKSTHLTAGSLISDTPGHSSYSHSNPWDLEDLDGSYYGEADSLSSVSPVDRPQTQPFPRPGPSAGSYRSEPSKDQQPDPEQTAPWEQEMKSKHSRNVSHATLAEREAFQKDLEERQKAIQEALKSKMDESRSGSPTPSMGGAMKAFGMLRAKSSRDTLASRPPASSKSINMLGMGANASNASLSRTSEEHLKKQRERLANSPMPSDDDYRREFEDRLTRGASGNDQSSKSRSPSASGGQRSRSNSQISAVSGRSRSRTGRRESSDQTPPPIPTQIPRAGLPTPESPVIEPPPNPPALRMRSSSRPSASGYFDQKSLHPIQTGVPNGMPRVAPVSAGATPHVSPGFAPGRSPIAPGSRSAGHSPGIAPTITKAATFAAHSNHSSPAIAAAPPPRRAVPPERKKSIAKSLISEPMFVSSTSVVDTIELPAGASLRNGMGEVAPPLPPINPMRRRFGFGRSDSSSTTTSDGRPSTEDGDNKVRTRMRKGSNPSLFRSSNHSSEEAPPMRAPPTAPPVEEGAMF